MEITAPVLAGKWVRLEPFAEEHREPLRVAADDDRVWQYMYFDGRGAAFDRPFNDALQQRAEGKRLPYAVRLLSTGELIGATSYIEPNAQHKRVEIGWTWLGPEFQRSALNTEAKYLMMRHAFESWGMMRVEFKTSSTNLKSQNAMRRLGLVEEGTMRKWMYNEDGTTRDTVWFSCVDDEWPAMKARLERLMAR